MTALLVAAAVLVSDQISKYFVVSRMRPGESRSAISNLVDWVFVQNRHGAYGLFGDNPLILIILGALVMLALWYGLRAQLSHSLPARIAYSAITGGAIGNIIDRLHYGYVVDFISVRPMPFFEVFNIADSAIVIGMSALILLSLSERPSR